MTEMTARAGAGLYLVRRADRSLSLPAKALYDLMLRRKPRAP